MSSFGCEVCGAACVDSPRGYTTGCEHYPPDIEAVEPVKDLHLVLIRGLPGSGKSTYARTEWPSYLHYEPDHIACDTQGRYRFDAQLWGRICDLVLDVTDLALARGESVVVSEVFATAASIEPYRTLAEFHGASFKVITRTQNFGSIHNVPRFAIERMRAAFEEVV